MENQISLNENNVCLDVSNNDSYQKLIDFIRETERAMLARRVSNGRKNALKQGKVMLSTPPYGYKLEQGKLIIDPQEVHGVTTIFELLKKGKTVNEVSKLLNERGMLTKKGRKWTLATVRNIAKSRVYIGELYFNKTKSIYENGKRKTIRIPTNQWIKVNVLPLVSKDIFNSVQDRLKIKIQNRSLKGGN